MKKIFYLGLTGLLVFEILRVYFIMPMPGSQDMNSLDAAYFLHVYRWPFRILFAILIIAGASAVFKSRRKWIPISLLLLTSLITYAFNFKMTAEEMFLQTSHLELKPASSNELPADALIMGVVLNNEARAYPIRFLAYHHQVADTFGGKNVMITYCSVCRTGRVFEPIVNGSPEKFRLVGMDHFNAMFEDETTGSWWRQATGEAVSGPLTGATLPELPCYQMTLSKWLQLYPQSLVMQADESFIDCYDMAGRYEQGKSQGDLTRMDSLSWMAKSWVVGVRHGDSAKAYDWNILKRQRVINDEIGGQPIAVVLAADGQSFAAYQSPDGFSMSIRNDTMMAGSASYNLLGKNLDGSAENLVPVYAVQEYWHSWKEFHPGTTWK